MANINVPSGATVVVEILFSTTNSPDSASIQHSPVNQPSTTVQGAVRTLTVATGDIVIPAIIGAPGASAQVQVSHNGNNVLSGWNGILTIREGAKRASRQFVVA